MSEDKMNYTQEELIALLEEEQQKNEGLTKRLKEKDELVAQSFSGDKGWLVQAPQPDYDGYLYGVRFTQGQAFIIDGQKIEAFEFKPSKEGTLKNQGLTDDQIKEVRAREKVSSSLRWLEMVKVEYPDYKVIRIESNEDLQGLVDVRMEQKIQLQSLQSSQRNAKAISEPGFMGEAN